MDAARPVHGVLIVKWSFLVGPLAAVVLAIAGAEYRMALRLENVDTRLASVEQAARALAAKDVEQDEERDEGPQTIRREWSAIFLRDYERKESEGRRA